MADINAAANGTLNQDPFAVNVMDGVGQGQEPEISPTAPDDELNKDADELPLLNDTDHSTGWTESNYIQDVQRKIADTDCGDHEFRGDLQSFMTVDFDANEEEIAVQQAQAIETALESLELLTKYQRKWAAVGINQSDVADIESRVSRGLLSAGMASVYTTESSDVNLSEAQTRVTDRMTTIKLELRNKLGILK